MKRLEYIYYILLIFSLMPLYGCEEDPDNGKPVVGFAQCALDTEWRKAMNKKFIATALKEDKFVLKVTNGNQDNVNQIKDITDSLLAAGIQVLMVSPNASEPLTPIVSEIYKKGIPVILIDRATADTNYTCFIGANNFLIGRMAGDYAGLNGKDGATIMEIIGERGASSAKDRGDGFKSKLEESYQHKKFVRLPSLYGRWDKGIAKSAMCKYLDEHPHPDIIYAQNDEMAIGAALALREYDVDLDDVIIIGTDATANCGIKAVVDGLIDATFRYQDGAEEAIMLAEQILAGDYSSIPESKKMMLHTYQIDKTNAEGQYQTMKTEEVTQDMLIQISLINKSQNAQINGQIRTIILGSIGLGVMIILLLYVAKLHMEKEKTNQQLNEKNAEVNAQKEELEAQTAHLNEVNRQLESSKNMILGSINTAKRIQTATLPTVHDMNKAFKSFVEYHPKDIVSGDFYWNYCEEVDGDIIQITGVIDCTGHGVPGAFMSLIGVNLLDQIVKQEKVFSPAQILGKLNIAVRKALKQQDPNNDNDDGMEGIICKIERKQDGTLQMCYEGAKFPIFHYIKSEDRIETCKSSRRPIGGKVRNIESQQEFTDHPVEISHGDRLYLTSDGLSDQSNQAHTKYRSIRLIQKLQESVSLPMREQGDYVWKDVATYMLGCTQRDDITVIGIEV